MAQLLLILICLRSQKSLLIDTVNSRLLTLSVTSYWLALGTKTYFFNYKTQICVSSALLKLLHVESKSFLDFEIFDIISAFLVQARWLPGKLKLSSSDKEIYGDRWRMLLFYPLTFVYLLGPLGRDVWFFKMFWLVILGFLCNAYTQSHFCSQVICRPCVLWPEGTWGKISLIGTGRNFWHEISLVSKLKYFPGTHN